MLDSPKLALVKHERVSNASNVILYGDHSKLMWKVPFIGDDKVDDGF